MIGLTRRYGFPAAHILCHPSFSPEENARVYGKCANPEGHGHDYRIDVTVSGRIDSHSGRIIDRDLLDAIVEERVLSRFSHRMLNESSAFEALVPTAENIAKVIHRELAQPIEERSSAKLVRVRVQETDRSSFSYGETHG